MWTYKLTDQDMTHFDNTGLYFSTKLDAVLSLADDWDTITLIGAEEVVTEEHYLYQCAKKDVPGSVYFYVCQTN